MKPEDMTLDEIKEQLALYNRLYYQKRRLEKDFMDTKRASAIRYSRRKKIDKLAENGELELKDIDCDKKSEENKDKLRTTKPRKYKGETFKIINVE